MVHGVSVVIKLSVLVINFNRMSTELKKRLLSFAWRLGGMVIATVLAFLGDNLDLINASPAVIGIVGLVIGELTKLANNYFSGKV